MVRDPLFLFAYNRSFVFLISGNKKGQSLVDSGLFLVLGYFWELIKVK